MDRYFKRNQPSCSHEASEKTKKVRKYDDSYLNVGFTVLGNRPQCVLCSDVLSAESMKPSKLMRHLETKHSSVKGKPIEFFRRKLSVLQNQQMNITKIGNVSEMALHASYLVALRIAKKGKPHAIAEDLILPCAKDMVSCMLSSEDAEKLTAIPLSNDTMARRISEMTEIVREQLNEKIKRSEYFSIQIDESTDVSNCAQFLCFIRFEADGSIQEEILFCKSVPDHTTGECLFQSFMEATKRFKIDWGKCIAICSDGAKSLTGVKSGLVHRLRAIMPNAKWVHCFLHRQALATKKMPAELQQVLTEAVKVVNFIKSRPLQCRLFEKLCNEMGSIHKALLLHTEVRWLSRGKVLNRLFELRSELLLFLQDANPQLAECFSSPTWLFQLAYLADIFMHINELNAELQGRNITILKAQDKINGFLKKLNVYAARVKNSDFENFPLCYEFKSSVIDTEHDIDYDSLSDLISTHITELRNQIISYIPLEENVGCQWILHPFNERAVEKAEIPSQLHDKLMELSSDSILKLEFASEEIDKFWLSRRREYPGLVSEVLRSIIPFATSYLCELGFSTMLNLKTKPRNRLDLENALIMCVTGIEPDIKKLVKSKQAQVSH